MATFGIIGTGAGSPQAIEESLRDTLGKGDIVLVGWVGKPIPQSMETVYKFLLEEEIDFGLYHRPEEQVIRHFREADTCTVTQSRHPLDAILKDADHILFLWDDDENDATPSLIQYVMDHKKTDANVLELSNGLAPITIDYEIPEAEPAHVEPEDDEDDDTRFTRDELEEMTAAGVKRYGARLGCEARTKVGIIEELFGPEQPEESTDHRESDESEEPSEEPVPQEAPVAVVRPHDVLSDLGNIVANFQDHAKPSFSTSMAMSCLEQARLWMLKSLSE